MKIDRVRIAELFDVDEGWVLELEEHQIIVPDETGGYDARALERLRVCCGLSTLGVNLAGLEVALDLLERWQDERRRVQRLLDRLERELERDLRRSGAAAPDE
ncbi:MAG: hypothetical protein SangKO_015520 [Sandaracinaceae bacterium]|nr:MAG: hypothetical protein EVA89_30620 [Sandaracinaceae bacterium]